MEFELLGGLRRVRVCVRDLGQGVLGKMVLQNQMIRNPIPGQENIFRSPSVLEKGSFNLRRPPAEGKWFSSRSDYGTEGAGG